jgi:hypothetical protein
MRPTIHLTTWAPTQQPWTDYAKAWGCVLLYIAVVWGLIAWWLL